MLIKLRDEFNSVSTLVSWQPISDRLLLARFVPVHKHGHIS